MKCHMWSPKTIHESQCTMDFKIIGNVRLNATTEKKNGFYSMNTDIHILAYFSIVLSFHPTVFLENWGLLQATFLMPRSAKLHLAEASSSCQLTCWSQLFNDFVWQYNFQTCNIVVFCPFYLFICGHGHNHFPTQEPSIISCISNPFPFE